MTLVGRYLAFPEILARAGLRPRRNKSVEPVTWRLSVVLIKFHDKMSVRTTLQGGHIRVRAVHHHASDARDAPAVAFASKPRRQRISLQSTLNALNRVEIGHRVVLTDVRPG